MADCSAQRCVRFIQDFPIIKWVIKKVAVPSDFYHCAQVMKTNTLKLSAQRGFSLVELLVVIAVIAIIAAIAIPNIAGITGAANTAKTQRNAQNLASTYNAAIAAGYAGTNSEAAAVAAITNGVTVVIGNTTNSFRVDGLSSAESTSAQTYLGHNTTNNTLIYTATTN